MEESKRKELVELYEAYEKLDKETLIFILDHVIKIKMESLRVCQPEDLKIFQNQIMMVEHMKTIAQDCEMLKHKLLTEDSLKIIK